MPITIRVSLALLLGAAPAVPLTAQAPSFEQIGAYVQGGIDALAKGDTAGYLAGSGKAFAIAASVPPVAYHHARALALNNKPDSALLLLDLLAREGAVTAFGTAEDSAFIRLRASPTWRTIADRLSEAQRPVSNSSVAFELPERDLAAEGTAWDARSGTVYLSSLYKRKIVAIAPDGRARDFIPSGRDGIGPVVGIEVDPARRGLWAASMMLPEGGIPLTDTTYAAHGLLFHYDVDTGRLRRRYVLRPRAGVRHGFNDVTVMPNGDVYVTDSQAGAVYLVKADADSVTQVIAPGTYTFPNGITRSDDGRQLFVSHGAGIDRIDVATSRQSRLVTPDTLNLGGVDGLAFYRNSLIAHQPSWYRRVIRLELNPAYGRVVSWRIIERHHPRFDFPTTGEVAGDSYYYIANAQLRRFRDGKIFPWDSLSPVLVLKTDLREAGAAASGAMREAIRSGAAPGAAAAVAVDGRIVWSEGFGVSDVATGRPVTSATRFGIGSISKTLTLAAALRLADEAALDLDAPVERYLPDFPYRGRGITIRRIGVHQSGISDAVADRYYSTTRHFDTLDPAYREIVTAPIAFTPGTKAEYATGLFTIVGRVLERVSGEPYPRLMRDRIFAPAGMTATVPSDPRRPPAERTAFYVRRDGGGFAPAPVVDPSHKLPGAGFLSTAEDLARFGSALLAPGFLSKHSRQELMTPVPLADGTPTMYALGFQVREEEGRRLLLQPGGGLGIAGWLAVYPDDGVVVAILANATGAPLGDEVRRAVAAEFLTPRAPGPSPRPAQARREP